MIIEDIGEDVWVEVEGNGGGEGGRKDMCVESSIGWREVVLWELGRLEF